jgi:nuclear pore complex protein Nup85
MVHSGFLAAYDTVRPRVIALVSALTAGASPDDPWVIWVTGHSLGGALATLCAYELAGRR